MPDASTASPTARGWQEQARPALLFKRFEFEDYAHTRAFLDALNELSERVGLYPRNLSFSSSHVNVTVDADGEALGERERDFARRLDELAQGGD